VAALRREIAQLERLIVQARQLEQTEVETKLARLKELLRERGVFDDPHMKLLVFTEHKDTLDYLAGDGREGRPLGKLLEWGLTVTQIHGHMKVGDEDTPGTRIRAEREFKDRCQVMVATEAAGEGINLQFCWLMINDDFAEAAPLVGISAPGLGRRAPDAPPRAYRLGRLPRGLLQVGQRLERRYGRLAQEYKAIALDKCLVTAEATLEWVTPGHPLFESIREATWERVADDLERGAAFFDVHRAEPARLDVYTAAIGDGLGHTVEQRVFVMEVGPAGQLTARQATIFEDLAAAPTGTSVPDGAELPSTGQVEQALVEVALQPLLVDVFQRRRREIARVREHVESSLNALLDGVSRQYGELYTLRAQGSTEAGIEGRLQQFDNRLTELNARLETRQAEPNQESQLMIRDIRLVGRAWVLPHPERSSSEIVGMVRDDEVERIAIREAIAHEEARGWRVESVEKENLGYDLRSRRPHPEDPETSVEVRLVEVKGRAGVGEVALSDNEYRRAEALGRDYWLYVAYDCASNPTLHIVRDPARLGWRRVAPGGAGRRRAAPGRRMNAGRRSAPLAEQIPPAK
jgi:hypothetical protein